jgi:GNAT superfamily N-acetyltransferase
MPKTHLNQFRSHPAPKIRRATTADRSKIARAYHAFWHETHAHLESFAIAADRNLAFFEKRLANTRIAPRLTHAADGSAPGFVIWDRYWVRSLFLAPTARGGGLGARLLAEAEHHIAARGHKRVALICIVGNHRARTFYERHGYRVARLHSSLVKTSSGEVVVKGWLMQKHLPAANKLRLRNPYPALQCTSAIHALHGHRNVPRALQGLRALC